MKLLTILLSDVPLYSTMLFNNKIAQLKSDREMHWQNEANNVVLKFRIFIILTNDVELCIFTAVKNKNNFIVYNRVWNIKGKYLFNLWIFWREWWNKSFLVSWSSGMAITFNYGKQESISTTSYMRVFHTKVNCAAFY